MASLQKYIQMIWTNTGGQILEINSKQLEEDGGHWPNQSFDAGSARTVSEVLMSYFQLACQFGQIQLAILEKCSAYLDEEDLQDGGGALAQLGLQWRTRSCRGQFGRRNPILSAEALTCSLFEFFKFHRFWKSTFKRNWELEVSQ